MYPSRSASRQDAGADAALQPHATPLWLCEGAFDALLAAGVPRVVVLFGVQGWRWAWARDVRDMVVALDADAAGQQAGRALAWQAALRGKRVSVLPSVAYGGAQDTSAAAGAGVLTIGTWAAAAAGSPEELMVPEDLREGWEERAAIMVYEGHLPRTLEGGRPAETGLPEGRRQSRGNYPQATGTRPPKIARLDFQGTE